MKASGNGGVATCANNLLLISRGEVPYERVKGLNARHIDKPADSADLEIKQDAEWLISTYEPRAELTGLSISGASRFGAAEIHADIAEQEG